MIQFNKHSTNYIAFVPDFTLTVKEKISKMQRFFLQRLNLIFEYIILIGFFKTGTKRIFEECNYGKIY